MVYTVDRERLTDAGTHPQQVSLTVKLQTTSDAITVFEPIRLQVPTLELLRVCAERLTKFKFPPEHHAQTLEQLLDACWVHPRPPKSFLETQPLAWIDSLTQALWHEALQNGLPSPATLNPDPLHAYRYEEALTQFNAVEWALQDIRLQEQRAWKTLGPTPNWSDLFKQASPHQAEQAFHLKAFLTELGYDSTLFSIEGVSPTTPANLAKLYLRARTQSYPLPWGLLITALTAASREISPPIKRLHSLYKALTPENTHQKPMLLPIPISVLVLVEGETERYVLPHFVEAYGMDSANAGILFKACGGKSQMVGQYQHYQSILNFPILMLMDADAAEQAAQIQPHLRSTDQVFLIEEGEIEDLYQPKWLIDNINKCYEPYPLLTLADLTVTDNPNPTHVNMSLRLKRLFETHHWGNFDKALFAEQYCQQLSKQPPDKIKHHLQGKSIHAFLSQLVQITNQNALHSKPTSHATLSA